MPSTTRRPPADTDAEESLLGAMLLSNAAALVGIEVCESSDFYKPAHGLIFGAIRTLIERGSAVDSVTVTDELKRAGTLDAVGDRSIFISLLATTPSIANARHYAGIVSDMASLRQLIEVSGEVADVAFEVPQDVKGTLDWAESRVFGISQKGTADDVRPWSEWMIDELYNLGEIDHTVVQGAPTGYTDLDALLGGLQPSNLVVIGARPSMGKTALALGICRHVAVEQNLPVLLFSLEMSSREIVLRMIGSEAHVDASRIRSGHSTMQDWDRIDNTLNQIEAPFFVNDNPMVSVLDMRAQARRQKARTGLGLVVVDYLQLMTTPAARHRENRVAEVSQISRGLKILARELDVPVIALSQLSRNLESRENKRPILSDLRESGSIEQDADIVAFLYREDAYKSDDAPPTGVAEVIVAKHRNGPTGTVRLSFAAREAAFRNLARRSDPPPHRPQLSLDDEHERIY